jgi:hypothetical protein
MTASRSLPARPSLESLRKQAKKLARDRSLSLRDAQLAIAREYGFAGWQDLTAEVSKRLGKGLELAVALARRIIHDNDTDGLKRLLAAHPALLTWNGDVEGTGLLGMATGAYGDAFDPERERNFTRAACAELLIDAGAVVAPSVPKGILQSRARGLLRLFQRKDLLPRTLDFLAALGDLDAVRSALDEGGHDFASMDEAFVRACGFHHEAVASLLLERLIALDPRLGARIDASVGREAFVKYFVEKWQGHRDARGGPWEAFVMDRVGLAVRDGDLTTFVSTLQREPWLLDDAHVAFQDGIIGGAALNDRGEILTTILDSSPAIVRRQPPPPTQAIEHALTYGHAHLVPLLTRIWPLPDDLPHAAGTGNLGRVTQWFDESGAPALGDPARHAPHTSVHVEANDPWEAAPAQKVLDTALAWSVINHYFDVADFLLAHGADINTRWNSHEPASILHTLVFEDDYEAMQYLIDRGIDMTIEDYRWRSTAAGWARYGKSDEKMAQWLEAAELQRRTR